MTESHESHTRPRLRGISLLLRALALAPLAAGIAAADAAQPAAGEKIIARLPDRTVTLQELDAAGGREIYDASQQLYEARARGLYRLLSEDLLNREAKAANVSVEQLLQKAVTATRDTVSEADIDAWLENRSAGAGQVARDAAARKQAVQYWVVKRRADEKRAYVATLFEKYGVRISLDLPPSPPREELLGAMEPVVGKPEAPVTIVVFSDYRCPYCKDSSRTLNRLVAARPEAVRVVYKHFPTHPESRQLAQAALCAGDQGRFPEYHNLLFDSAVKPADLAGLAGQAGLDPVRFSKCLDDGVHAARIDADLREGQRLGIQGTPTLFVNGLRLRGAQSYDRLSAQVEQSLRTTQTVSLSHVR